jgi:NAD(P)-dependent dehydrogenase (short-subunit alcohol dehydrogenase family)
MKRAALVTGGNRGIGLEVCRQLGQRGHVVLLGARSLPDGEAAVAALRAEGLDVSLLLLDVADEQSVVGVAGELAVRRLRLDVLVNNAGVALQGLDRSVAERTLNANFFGPLRLTAALRPRLVDGARVVVVSSGLAELAGLPARRRRDFDPPPSLAELELLARAFVADVGAGCHLERGWPDSAYRMSKVAINAATRRWAEAMPKLLVNAVCPGWVQTRMGGPAAPRTPAQGAVGITWAATLPPEGPTGGFFRDGQLLAW